MHMKKLSFFLFASITCFRLLANNIQVSNVSVLSATNQVQFDLSWENSWRSTVLKNWDAAWVFFKYKDLDGYWKHVYLSGTGVELPAGFTNTIPADLSGIFIFRSAPGNGANTITGIKLGIPVAQGLGVFDLKCFAIEMVYITEGPFWAGDFNGSVFSYTRDISVATPARLDQGISFMYDPIGGSSASYAAPNPNGSYGFYCMKYELSQGGYRDYLNCLTYTQQANHTVSLPNSPAGTKALSILPGGRSYLEVEVPGNSTSNLPAVYGCDADNDDLFNEPADGEWVACGYLNWPDKAAWLAWCCLVPMTELQFEKICRGPLQPVSSEYAWGTNQVLSVPFSLTNAGADNETPAPIATNPQEGNAVYFITYVDPVRNGAFASATSDRISSGGSYYGVMEMSGNLWETTITTANAQGRSYDGKRLSLSSEVILSSAGYAASFNFNITWPGMSGFPGSYAINGMVAATGLIYRGGSFSLPSSEMQVSNRNSAQVVSLSPELVRLADHGIRGVRNL